MRRQLIVIWAALLVSIAIYAGIIVMMSQTWEPKTGNPLQANPIVLILGAAAVGSLLMAFVVPAQMLTEDKGFERIRSAYVIRWALIESVAIYGVTGAFLTLDPRVFFVGGAVAVAAMLLAFPSEEGTAGVPPASSRRPAGE